MVLLILGGQALENLHRVLNGGLVHRHRLEPPLQSGVLLDGLAVLVEGGGANHLDLAPGEGGFQDVGGVHAALGVAGAHNVVNLVDHQNNVPQALHLVDKALHPALELAPELGAGHQSCQIQQVDLLVPQLEGHVALGDPLGQPLRDGGLTHTGLTDQAGVVLLAAVQDLHHPLDLLLPADHRVQLSLLGPLRQGDAVVLQIFALAVLRVLALLFPASGTAFLLAAALAALGGLAGEQAVQEGEGGGLALFLLFPGVLAAGQVLDILHAAHGLEHLIVERVQILVGNAHALHHIVHLGQAQLLGAFQAQALVGGLVPLHFGDEDNGHVLLAS